MWWPLALGAALVLGIAVGWLIWRTPTLCRFCEDPEDTL